jgi:hypothetical protein
LDLLLNLNEILNLLVCIGALILVLRWKDLSPKRYWWIAVGIAVALSIITNPSLHYDPKIFFEVPESLNKIANFAANAIAYFIIPLTLIVRVFQLESCWLALLSILMFIVYAFFFWLNLLVAPEYVRQAIDKFDGQDGYVYLAQEFFSPGLGVDYPYCLSFRQYQRIAPGVLVYRKSFAPKINKLDKYLSSHYGARKCSDSRDMVKNSIGQMRQRFPPKSSN